ncbi:MAG: hypothetical protein MUC50_17190 [Myxococcota bacterium]|nr:hypothetical protein [Myxococcota bacterium]
MTRKELRRGVRGPKGNPARRFAVWALAKDTLLTHAKLGNLLGMTGASVAKDPARPHKHIDSFSDWAEAWLHCMSIWVD